MKSFATELSKICSVDLATLLGGFNYTVYDNAVVCVEGAKKLLSYHADKVLVAISKGVLAIVGSNLVVKCYQGSYMVVVGEINSVGVQ